MTDNSQALSLLIKQFNDASQKKKAFNKAMQIIFEKLDEDSIDGFIEEEITMHKLLDDQRSTSSISEKTAIVEEYFQMIESSPYKAIRKQIAWLEEKYYENTIDDLFESYQKLKK